MQQQRKTLIVATRLGGIVVETEREKGGKEREGEKDKEREIQASAANDGGGSKMCMTANANRWSRLCNDGNMHLLRYTVRLKYKTYDVTNYKMKHRSLKNTEK